MPKLKQGEIEEFQKTLLDYFHEEGRLFPWRETCDPYHILVSEFMLQQTQTERVISKYNDWLKAFPTLESLSSAPFPEVMRQWVGLGYNRRSRFLQESAKTIVTKYHGVFPSKVEELESLPGIGPYTARAVSTFSFNVPNVFIETNIRAVYIFFFFQARTDVSDREILELVSETLYHNDPRNWYYALMDYGAALKKKVTNPGRQSKHYSMQTKFEGSLRQARGAIIRCLSAQKQAGIDEIAEMDGLPLTRIEKALKALESEGLVCEYEGKYTLHG